MGCRSARLYALPREAVVLVTGQTLASRTVTGDIAAMIVATAAATAVGFWLSYAGLHDFVLRAGLRGAKGWAWPGSVDLFILAGEAGVTIAALRRQQDKAAWVYLAIGFAASVTANVLHVDPSALAWTRYAVAAVPRSPRCSRWLPYSDRSTRWPSTRCPRRQPQRI